MHHTKLDTRVRIERLNGFWKTGESVHTGNEDILETTVLQFGEDRKPEFGPLMRVPSTFPTALFVLPYQSPMPNREHNFALVGSHAL